MARLFLYYRNKRYKMKNTLLVNLYAVPGAGKSTGAAYIFAKLKMAGIDCEYVSEYAKDRVWQDDQFPLKHCQLYVTGKQCLKITRLLGKVDVVVTDSPIAIGAMYTDEKPYQDVCLYEAKKYKNTYNIFVNRFKKYNTNGRNQTEDEAKEIDKRIKDFLTTNGIPFTEANGTEDGYNQIVKDIVDKLNKPKNYVYLVMEFNVNNDYITTKVCDSEKEANVLADNLMRETPGNRTQIIPVDMVERKVK